MEYNSEIQANEHKRNAINTSTMYDALLEEMDYFVVWRCVDEVSNTTESNHKDENITKKHQAVRVTIAPRL